MIDRSGSRPSRAAVLMSAVAALAACAGQGVAQQASTVKPIMWCHDGGQDPTWQRWGVDPVYPNIRAFFPSVGLVYLDDVTPHPHQAAEQLGAELRRMLDHGTPPDRLSFLIQNIGHNLHNVGPHFRKVALLRAEDALATPASWPEPTGPRDPRMQPWATTAKNDLRAWTEEFVRVFNTTTRNDPRFRLQGVNPSRLFLDTEVYLGAFFNRNHVTLAMLTATDAGSGGRWSGMRGVPGFDPSKTLRDLWVEYALDYNANVLPASTCDPCGLVNNENVACAPLPEDPMLFSPFLPPGMSDTLTVTNGRNRKFLYWFNSVSTIAKNAVLDESIYQPVRAGFPGLLASDYETGFVDGRPDTFGWRTARLTNCALGDPQRLGPSRTAPRGSPSGDHHGAETDPWAGYDDPDGRWWYAMPVAQHRDEGAPRPGVLSSPVFYALTDHHETENLYVPPGRPGRREARWDAAMRMNRQGLESIINSYGGGREGTVVPWILLPGVYAGTAQGGGSWFVGDDETRRLLLLFRHKRVPEVNVFFGTGVSWGEPQNRPLRLRRVWHEVYEPVLASVSPLQGDVQSPAPAQRAEFLDTTLRDSAGAEREVRQRSQGGLASVRADFTNVTTLAPAGEMDGLRVVLETRVSVQGVRGRVLLWNWRTGAWDALLINDAGRGQPEPEFDFAAPRDPFPAPSWSTRRDFVLRSGVAYVAPGTGEVRVRLDLRSPSGEFEAFHDLVQVCRSPSLGEGPDSTGPSGAGNGQGGLTSAPVGADMDADGDVTLGDALFYIEAFNAERLIADLDGDDDLTHADLQRFATMYTGGN